MNHVLVPDKLELESFEKTTELIFVPIGDKVVVSKIKFRRQDLCYENMNCKTSDEKLFKY